MAGGTAKTEGAVEAGTKAEPAATRAGEAGKPAPKAAATEKANEALASRNVWSTFGDKGVNLGGRFAPSADMIGQVLNSAGGQAQRIGEAIRSGKLKVEYGNLPPTTAGRYFPGSGELTLNRNFNWSGKSGLQRAAVTAVHEGQHYLDDVAKIAANGMHNNRMYFEARAFLAEQKFAESIGKPALGMLGELEEKLGSRSAAWEQIKKAYGYGAR